MSDIVLSKGIRNNLLQLQKTADNVALTQGRLATGKKVNSALDNPTNFFTASALNSRASDLNSLLDGLANGIKVLEAADNGLKSITKSIESLQSTVRQARQDKTFKTVSYELDRPSIGNAAIKNLTFSGGAVGAVGVDVQINDLAVTGVQNQIVTANNTYTAPVAATSGSATSGAFAAITFDNAGDNVSFSINVDGGGAVAVTLTNAMAQTINGGVIDTIARYESLIEVGLSAAGVDGVAVGNNGTNITLTSATTGATSTVAITGITATDGGGANNLTTTGGLANTAGAAGVNAVNREITISDGTRTAAVTLTAANGADAQAAAATISAAMATAGIAGSATGSNANDQISLAGAANGSNTLTIGGAAATQVFGISGTRTVTAAVAADPGGARTVEEIVASINTNPLLRDKIRASNDNGKLRVENLSTAPLDITGLSMVGGVLTATGSATTTTGAIMPNEVRRNLVVQFNELRNQLDKFADDASFNGINLLRGDRLKLYLNENSTSTIEIQAKDNLGNVREISNASLNIAAATEVEFESDATLDVRLADLKTSLDTIRSQASSFGSNLSIVQNREDFTKATINTLRTGADNLTLADMNEEAANLLSLQTRQQLSQTALSLANQADQGVLRLFS